MWLLSTGFRIWIRSWEIIDIFKVKILWEGRKIWKNLPPVLTKQLFLVSSVKTSGRFFQTFVAFSKKLEGAVIQSENNFWKLIVAWDQCNDVLSPSHWIRLRLISCKDCCFLVITMKSFYQLCTFVQKFF